MMNPLPNMDHAYSHLLQHENHREAYVNVGYNTDFVSSWLHHREGVIKGI